MTHAPPKDCSNSREPSCATPFTGIGKPEPLKHLGAGVWSRRITQEHRCVYQVGNGRVHFIQGRYHY